MHECEKKLPLAQAYVPFQEQSNMYPPHEALLKGTIYPELCRPYKSKR